MTYFMRTGSEIVVSTASCLRRSFGGLERASPYVAQTGNA